MVRQRHNLASLLGDFERHRADTAIVELVGLRRHRVTYGDLASLARRFAAELQRREIRKGDRVLLWGQNGADWVASFFGCLLQGVLAVPLDFASGIEFAQRVERETAPRLIVGSREKLSNGFPGKDRLFFDELQPNLPRVLAESAAGLTSEDPLQIVFTSGTTGEPKGVVHTHANVLASLEPIEREMQRYLRYEWIFHPIRILHTLPLSHVFGQFMGLWIPPLLAAEVHYEPRLVPGEIIQRISGERISVLAAVPRILDLMRDHIRLEYPNIDKRIASAEGVNAWKRWARFRDVHRAFGFKFWAFVCGGAALSSNAEQFWNKLGFLVVQGYGMTETTALISLNHPFRTTPGTIGQVLPGREVRLSDDGEVLVRGATISNATWESGHLQPRTSDWLATGDLAEFDQNGNLRFKGRKKEVIVTSSGMNIYPEDLEAALARQCGVKASAVIEAETERGPEPLAVLVLNPGEEGQRAVDSANQQLADYQQIRRWLAWPEPDLPRTSTGKPLKRVITDRVASGTLGGARNEDELPLDSLGRVQLQAELEQQYGVTLDDSALMQVTSRGEAEELVRRNTASPAPKSVAQQHSYPKWPWNPIQQCIRSIFLEIIAMPLVRILAAPRVIRKVAEFPAGPLLLVSNHVTSYDAAFILYAFPSRLRRRVAIAMSGEMLLDFRLGRNQGNRLLDLAGPIVYFLITALFNVFPLPQYSGFRRSFRHAGDAIDRGYSVLVFPEGRRSDDGTAQPFKSGVGLLWKELGVPALAVRLEGLGEIKSRNERWFRTGKICIEVNRVLSIDADASPNELTEQLRDAVFRG